jgi:hypothetical protein
MRFLARVLDTPSWCLSQEFDFLKSIAHLFLQNEAGGIMSTADKLIGKLVTPYRSPGIRIQMKALTVSSTRVLWQSVQIKKLKQIVTSVLSSCLPRCKRWASIDLIEMWVHT